MEERKINLNGQILLFKKMKSINNIMSVIVQSLMSVRSIYIVFKQEKELNDSILSRVTFNRVRLPNN